MDLNGMGIKVGAINPGMVETEFSRVRFKDDSEKADKVYLNFTPLQPGDIADLIWFTVTRPPHVNIADLTVMCLDQASSTIVNRK
jgi:NADP-dependent 3-hydroxy acid dehydrogenase YdfG